MAFRMGAPAKRLILREERSSAPSAVSRDRLTPGDIFEKMKLRLAPPDVGHVGGEHGLEEHV